MLQTERRQYLIRKLLAEQSRFAGMQIPGDEHEQRRLLRTLFNIRPPRPADGAFLEIQDAYLQEEIRRKGVTDIADLQPVQEGLYLWQGDITTLKCGAIVNAANSTLLGCFVPCHACIDNAIHTYSGIQLRAACAQIMERQGRREETGGAKITPAFNLPCDSVLHTVGPIITRQVTARDVALLASCYRSCLELGDEHGIKSVAFCCISTGEFHFPNEAAAQIALKAVSDYKRATGSAIEVVFNVFQDIDYQIYRNLLGGSAKAPKGAANR